MLGIFRGEFSRVDFGGGEFSLGGKGGEGGIFLESLLTVTPAFVRDSFKNTS